MSAAVRTATLALVVVLLACGGGGGGSDDDEERPAAAPPRVAEEGGETVVTLDADDLGRSGVVVQPLEAASGRRGVTAYGAVVDPTELASTGGSLVASAAMVARSRAALAASRAELERVTALHADERNASDKAVEAATARFAVDEADLRAAQAELDSRSEAARLRWGSVIAAWLEHGSPRLEAVIGQKERLALITFPPGVATGAPSDRTALITGNGVDVEAHLVGPAPRMDPRTQGLGFYYLAPAHPGLLPGASLTARVSSGPALTGAVVPRDAVVWWDRRSWVYIEKAPGKLVRREVATDSPVAGGWFVTSGVSAGQRVVVKGAQVLLSEEGRAAVHGSEG